LLGIGSLFAGKKYIHRSSALGDWVAIHLYEDLAALGRSKKFLSGIQTGTKALTSTNKRVGVKSRRGDGSFGDVVPNETPIQDPGYAVPRGFIATIEIGAEVKIVAKAMNKQIDRVIGDLRKQVDQFQKKGGNAICVGIVGINHAEKYTGYEKDREWPTTGKGSFKHPIQEAAQAEKRLRDEAAEAYDEFLILKFVATNEPPYPFSWVNAAETNREYGAALVRISNEYERRF